MVEHVVPRSDSPPPAFKPSATAFSPAVPLPLAGSSEAPTLIGRATAEHPLPEAPKNDPSEMERYRIDIEEARDISSLDDILCKLIKKRNISNNAEKLVLVAECYIRIVEFKFESVTTFVLKLEDADVPLNHLKQAVQVLQAYRHEVQDKCRLLDRMVSLYDRIKNGSPIVIRQEKQNCQILYYTARMELITDLMSKGDFSSAGEYLSGLTNLPEGVPPEQQIALIPILVKMIDGTKIIAQKNKWLNLTQQITLGVLGSIRATIDTPRNIALLKSFIAEFKTIKVPADGFSQNVTRLIALYLKDAERELNILEPKPKSTPLAITLLVLGALALLSFGVYRTYRHWSRA